MANESIFFLLFNAFIIGMLLLDLGVFSRRSHIVGFKEAAAWSAVWVMFALAFYVFLNYYGDLIHGIDSHAELHAIKEKYARHLRLHPEDFELSRRIYLDNMSLEFITGYVMEYALSVDNIFVILMIFSSFNVREIYYKKVLFWGILGAIVMRFAFIFLGSTLIQKADWVLYVFGAFLIFTGIRMFLNRNEDEQIEPKNHPVVKFASRYFAVIPRFVGNHFFVRRRHGKLMITPLFLVVLIIEFTDLIFAVDSVPAVFSITKDPYVVYFSNIFAIMGLRSMFFFLTNIMHLFHYLKVGLSVLLLYIGAKMLAHHYLEAIGFETYYSLIVIVSILAVSIVASLLFPAPQKGEQATPIPKPSVKEEGSF
jgi:tellurite resistance protein TerC